MECTLPNSSFCRLGYRFRLADHLQTILWIAPQMVCYVICIVFLLSLFSLINLCITVALYFVQSLYMYDGVSQRLSWLGKSFGHKCSIWFSGFIHISKFSFKFQIQTFWNENSVDVVQFKSSFERKFVTSACCVKFFGDYIVDCKM